MPKEVFQLFEASVIDVLGISDPIFPFFLTAFEMAIDEQEGAVVKFEI